MPRKKRRKSLTVGDRARDKLTGRVGTVTDVRPPGREEQVSLAYDAAPQDQYLSTPAKDGAQRPKKLVEPA